MATTPPAVLRPPDSPTLLVSLKVGAVKLTGLSSIHVVIGTAIVQDATRTAFAVAFA